MLVACWSAKGGSGTTVVAAALATELARRSASGALLVDLDGDLPAVLGIPDPAAGVGSWLGAGGSVPPDALARLEVPVGDRLSLLGLGDEPPPDATRVDVLAAVLGADPRPVVVDCGSRPGPLGAPVAAAATVSLLVLRPCYLALRRAVASPLRPSGVVLVREPGRSIGRRDVEAALGVPVRAVVGVHETIARRVDAGLLAGRLPGGLLRDLSRAA